jgi:SET domain-containing protein 6
MPNQSIETD